MFDGAVMQEEAKSKAKKPMFSEAQMKAIEGLVEKLAAKKLAREKALAKRDDEELDRIIRAWAEARNVGLLRKAGPDSYTFAEAKGEYPALAVWECERVTAALMAFGGGVYYPLRLIELLDLVYWFGKKPTDFCLFDPGRGMSKEILQLGVRSHDVVRMSIAKFKAMLKSECEKHPKPRKAKDFETS